MRKLHIPTVVFACLANILYSTYVYQIRSLKCCVTVETVQVVSLGNAVTLNYFFILAKVNSLSSRDIKIHSSALPSGME